MNGKGEEKLNRVEVEVTSDGAETKDLTHLALIAAFCIILMI